MRLFSILHMDVPPEQDAAQCFWGFLPRKNVV